MSASDTFFQRALHKLLTEIILATMGLHSG
jgi:hypothetical protein